MENHYKLRAIVLEIPKNIFEFKSNLFQIDNPLSKYFRDNI